MVSPLESPCVGNWGILCHDVCVGLSWFRSLPWFHHRRTLPVHILKSKFLYLHIYILIQQLAFVRGYSHHHEVQLTISCAHSFKFKCDAAKLCPRTAWHRHWEPDGQCKKECLKLEMTKTNRPHFDKKDGDWKSKVTALTWTQEHGCSVWGSHYLSFQLHSGYDHLQPPILKGQICFTTISKIYIQGILTALTTLHLLNRQKWSVQLVG